AALPAELGNGPAAVDPEESRQGAALEDELLTGVRLARGVSPPGHGCQRGYGPGKVRAEAVQPLQMGRERVRSQFDVAGTARRLHVKRPDAVRERHHNRIEGGDPALRSELRADDSSLLEPEVPRPAILHDVQPTVLP